MSKNVPCPTCGKTVEWSHRSPWRPFCSERCRTIDLGEWLGENRRISGDETPPEEAPDVPSSSEVLQR